MSFFKLLCLVLKLVLSKTLKRNKKAKIEETFKEENTFPQSYIFGLPGSGCLKNLLEKHTQRSLLYSSRSSSKLFCMLSMFELYILYNEMGIF